MTTGKVAVPYYGRLYRAKVGYERIFFLVDEVSSKGNELDVSLGVWDDKVEQSLPEWLMNNGVRNLICRENLEAHLKKALARLGIDILDEENSDVSRLMQALMV